MVLSLVAVCLLLVLETRVVSAFLNSHQAGKSKSRTADLLDSSTSLFPPSAWLLSDPQTAGKRCGPCPENDDDDDDDEKKLLDRREAAFAMLGTLWATTTFPAHAQYGAEPKIEMPNMVENMANRANKQCLVESLGNRECLVYMDEDNKLYQGLDTQKLLEKIDKSSVALTKIPELVEAKKWSSVNSLLTGPMGELLSTLNQLAPLSTQQPDTSIGLAKQVKLQVFAIGAAADKKDGTGILKPTQGATDALVAFVQSL